MKRAANTKVESGAIAVDRRHDPAVRKRMSAPAVRTFFNIARAWGLSVAEQRALLGWPAASTYHKYKAGDVGALAYDTLTRVSLVLGIYKPTAGSSCPTPMRCSAARRRSRSWSMAASTRSTGCAAWSMRAAAA